MPIGGSVGQVPSSATSVAPTPTPTSASPAVTNLQPPQRPSPECSPPLLPPSTPAAWSPPSLMPSLSAGFANCTSNPAAGSSPPRNRASARNRSVDGSGSTGILARRISLPVCSDTSVPTTAGCPFTSSMPTTATALAPTAVANFAAYCASLSSRSLSLATFKPANRSEEQTAELHP